MMTHTFSGGSAVQQNTVDVAKRLVYQSNEKLFVPTVNGCVIDPSEARAVGQ